MLTGRRACPFHLLCLLSSFCEHLWSLDRAGTHICSSSSFLVVWMSAPWLTPFPCTGGNLHVLLPFLISSSYKIIPTGMHQIPVSGGSCPRQTSGGWPQDLPFYSWWGNGETLPFFIFFYNPITFAPHLCSTRASGGHAVDTVLLEFGLHLKQK